MHVSCEISHITLRPSCTLKLNHIIWQAKRAHIRRCQLRFAIYVCLYVCIYVVRQVHERSHIADTAITCNCNDCNCNCNDDNNVLSQVGGDPFSDQAVDTALQPVASPPAYTDEALEEV